MKAFSHPSDDKSHRVLAEDLTAEWTHKGTTYRVTVPEGFRYRPGIGLRLGSLGLLDLFGPTYALETASAVHDWLYSEGPGAKAKKRQWVQHGGIGLGASKEFRTTYLNREEADAAMYADDGDSRGVQNVAWVLVRLFGWTVW